VLKKGLTESALLEMSGQRVNRVPGRGYHVPHMALP
jgi:hypothetical protein